jgi:hypothetical protein
MQASNHFCVANVRLFAGVGQHALTRWTITVSDVDDVYGLLRMNKRKKLSVMLQTSLLWHQRFRLSQSGFQKKVLTPCNITRSSCHMSDYFAVHAVMDFK